MAMQVPNAFGYCLATAALCGVMTTEVAAGELPSYDGRTASEWLETYDRAEVYRNPGAREMANQAFRAMGTNAVPFLLDALKEVPVYEGRFLEYRRKQGRVLEARWALLALEPEAMHFAATVLLKEKNQSKGVSPFCLTPFLIQVL